jgi:hypothetical protein
MGRRRRRARHPAARRPVELGVPRGRGRYTGLRALARRLPRPVLRSSGSRRAWRSDAAAGLAREARCPTGERIAARLPLRGQHKLQAGRAGAAIERLPLRRRHVLRLLVSRLTLRQVAAAALATGCSARVGRHPRRVCRSTLDGQRAGGLRILAPAVRRAACKHWLTIPPPAVLNSQTTFEIEP